MILRGARLIELVDPLQLLFSMLPIRFALSFQHSQTKERRRVIQETCKENGIHCFFIESICDDIKLIRENVQEVKVSSPDYLDVDPQAAVDDFMQRIKHYEDGYETITPEEGLSFVKTINVGTQFVINEITGYLPSRVVYFLMNLNISATSFYLSRHGESVFNERGLIGGDSDLSERGKEFSIKLPAFFDSLLDKDAEEREVRTEKVGAFQLISRLPFGSLL